MDRAVALFCVVIMGAVGCGESNSASNTPSAPPTVAFNKALHDELMTMFEEDQATRMKGQVDVVGDEERTERLKEIIAEYGWPTFDLVGEDGADAAWTIAQHSDLDPTFQREGLNSSRRRRQTVKRPRGTLPTSKTGLPREPASRRPTAHRSDACAGRRRWVHSRIQRGSTSSAPRLDCSLSPTT
jgi:hypothetical protein